MAEKEPDHGGVLAWLARKSVAANLLMILLLAGGVWSALHIQKEVMPAFELDFIEVEVAYPGSSPEEVEQGIIEPVEEAIREVAGIKEYTSRAREGRGEVVIELISGVDRMKVFQEVDQAVNRIRTFPDDIERPEVVIREEVDDVMDVTVYGPIDVWSLRKLGEQLRVQLLAQHELSRVELTRVPDYMTHVEISQQKLREYGLSLGAVARIIRESSGDIPAGAIETSGGEIMLRMKERKEWANELAEIEVIGGESGAILKLGDLANIYDGFEERGFHPQFNGQPAIGLGIYQTGKQSPIDVERAVLRVLETFEKSLPDGVQTRIAVNDARDFRERLDILTTNGVMAIFIVVGILALFLEFRLALWVMMGMMTSFIGGFIFLPMFDVSINMLSMFAFIVSLGIVVDDAIIVGENIYEYRDRGYGMMEASILGVKEVAGPVTFSIATNIIAFVPLLFIPGPIGGMMAAIPIVVISVLVISLFEALVILPAHLAHGKVRRTNALSVKLHAMQQRFSKGFSHFVNTRYRSLLKTCLRHRYVTFCGMCALFVIVVGYVMSGHTGVILMPEQAAHEIEAGVNLAPDTTKAQAARVADEVTAATQRMFDEHDLHKQAYGVKTNVWGGRFIDVEIVMKPPKEREMRAGEVIRLWQENIGDIDGIDRITFEAERGAGSWRPDIVVDLSHTDTDTIVAASAELLERVRAYTSVFNSYRNYDSEKRQLDITMRPAARLLGISPEDVGQQVRDAFYGALATRQLRGDNEVEIRVRLPEDERQTFEIFENLTIFAPDGSQVPLLEVVDIEPGQALSNITRSNGRRTISVNLDVEPKNQMGQVAAALRDKELPELSAMFPGLVYEFKGSDSEMKSSTSVLFGGFGLAMFVVYTLLAIAFNSYTQPLIVMIAIPFGIIGGILGHMVLGYDLSFISVMGMLALSGVVINDSLIMIDFANKNRGELSAFDTIVQAGVRRFRPIILTTLTTFGGLTPIILDQSVQSAFLIPMAISLGFGIVFATSIILVLVPALYLIFEDFGRKLRGQ